MIFMVVMDHGHDDYDAADDDEMMTVALSTTRTNPPTDTCEAEESHQRG